MTAKKIRLDKLESDKWLTRQGEVSLLNFGSRPAPGPDKVV